MDFKDILNNLMYEHQISNEDLSYISGISSSTIKRIRNGAETEGSENILESLAMAVLKIIKQLDPDAPLDDLKLSFSPFMPEKIDIKEITHNTNSLKEFLDTMDTFDIDEYLDGHGFDDLKTVKKHIPSSKTYYGIDGINEARIDFLQATASAKHVTQVYIFDDMDPQLSGDYLNAILKLIKRGAQINVIHNMDKPFYQMIENLNAWLPLYMTGKVIPSYIADQTSNWYRQMHYSSDAASLFGEAITGGMEDGKAEFSRAKRDIEYATKKSINIWAKSSPLIEIFTEGSLTDIKAFLNQLKNKFGSYENDLYAPPIFTISNDLILQLLDKVTLSVKLKNQIMDTIDYIKSIADDILKESTMFDNIKLVSKEEFEKNPISVDFSFALLGVDIKYSYEEYLQHIRETEEYSIENPAYQCEFTDTINFKNINVRNVGDDNLLISKNATPSVHFLVKNRLIARAIMQLDA